MKVDLNHLVNLIKEYDENFYYTENLYAKLIAKELSKKFGIHFSVDNSSIQCDSLGFDESLHKFNTYESLERTIKDLLGNDYTDVQLKGRYDYSMSNFYFDKNKIGRFSYRGVPLDISYSIASLFDILLYGLTGEATKNLAEANELEKKAKKNDDDNALFFRTRYSTALNYGTWVDLGKAVDKFFDGISLKIFQNQNGLIKGLTDEEWQRILYLQDICSKKLR